MATSFYFLSDGFGLSLSIFCSFWTMLPVTVYGQHENWVAVEDWFPSWGSAVIGPKGHLSARETVPLDFGFLIFLLLYFVIHQQQLLLPLHPVPLWWVDLVVSLSWHTPSVPQSQCWVAPCLLPTCIILSLCGPFESLGFAIHKCLVCQVSVFKSPSSIDRTFIMGLLAELWPTESSLYVGMKGIFKNKLKIKLWTALELCLFLDLKICWYALNCSCRTVIFAVWR